MHNQPTESVSSLIRSMQHGTSAGRYSCLGSITTRAWICGEKATYNTNKDTCPDFRQCVTMATARRRTHCIFQNDVMTNIPIAGPL